MPPVKAARCCQHVCGSRYADDRRRLVAWTSMRVLIVEDEPYLAEAIRDGLRLAAIAADIAGDGDTALELLSVNASGFELGADDYLTKPFELRELVLRLRALDRRRAHNRPPVREIAGLRL